MPSQSSRRCADRDPEYNSSLPGGLKNARLDVEGLVDALMKMATVAGPATAGAR
jgi:hypothetical protein